jgi:hypothetical protein
MEIKLTSKEIDGFIGKRIFDIRKDAWIAGFDAGFRVALEGKQIEDRLTIDQVLKAGTN